MRCVTGDIRLYNYPSLTLNSKGRGLQQKILCLAQRVGKEADRMAEVGGLRQVWRETTHTTGCQPTVVCVIECAPHFYWPVRSCEDILLVCNIMQCERSTTTIIDCNNWVKLECIDYVHETMQFIDTQYAFKTCFYYLHLKPVLYMVHWLLELIQISGSIGYPFLFYYLDIENELKGYVAGLMTYIGGHFALGHLVNTLWFLTMLIKCDIIC